MASSSRARNVSTCRLQQTFDIVRFGLSPYEFVFRSLLKRLKLIGVVLNIPDVGWICPEHFELKFIRAVSCGALIN